MGIPHPYRNAMLGLKAGGDDSTIDDFAPIPLTADGSKVVTDAALSGEIAAATEFAQGAVAGAADKGGVALVVRKDAGGALTGVADGDYSALQTDANGALRVVLPAGGGGLTDSELRASAVAVDPSDRALRDGGKVDVASLDQYTPLDVDPTAGTDYALPVALRQSKAYAQVIAYDGSNNPLYVGWAPPGTATSAALWRVKKLLYTGGLLTSVVWADGNDTFDNVWDNRAALSYS